MIGEKSIVCFIGLRFHGVLSQDILQLLAQEPFAIG